MAGNVHHRAPRIHHLHPVYRPIESEARHQLLTRVGEVLHINTRTQELLKHYADYEENEKVSGALVNEVTNKHPEDYRKELVQLGLISVERERSVNIDWERIAIFAEHLQAKETEAIIKNLVIPPVEDDAGKSITAELKARKVYVPHETKKHAFTNIELMTEQQLSRVIKQYAMLQSATHEAPAPKYTSNKEEAPLPY